MNEARAPTDEKLKGKILNEYRKGAKPKALSEKFDISINTIKSWISREKAKVKEPVKDAPEEKKDAPGKGKKGAPPGNKNAEGAGAPDGNKNAEKHGAYSSVYWDVLTPEEREMIEGTPEDEEALLMEQIQLFAVRERRIMQAINKYSALKGGMYMSNVSRIESKRAFKTPEDEQRYNELSDEKIKKGDKMPGQGYELNTSTNATIDLISRLEKELTSIQSKKTKTIDSLLRLRLENRKFEDAGKGGELVDDWIASVMGEPLEGGEEG